TDPGHRGRDARRVEVPVREGLEIDRRAERGAREEDQQAPPAERLGGGAGWRRGRGHGGEDPAPRERPGSSTRAMTARMRNVWRPTRAACQGCREASETPASPVAAVSPQMTRTAALRVSPRATRRWEKCCRSPTNGERPCERRRRTTEAKSYRG